MGALVRGAEKASTARKTRVWPPEFRGIVSRRLLAVLMIICGLWLTVPAVAGTVLPQLTVRKLAEGVYLLPAPSFEVSAANAGFVTHIGVLEDPNGLILVGTGTSRRFAGHLKTFVERHFRRPVIAAVVLYGGGDHVLGNGYMEAQGVKVVAHAETDRFIRASCHTCVERLTAALGEDMMAGTEPTPATTLFSESGPMPGVTRKLRLLHFGHTFQPGATALLDEATGTLFTGELAANGYVPDLYNAQETGWRDALSQMIALAPRQVVPAHGEPGGTEVLERSRRYLDTLITQVDALFEDGVSLLESLDKVDAAGFHDWYGYTVWHKRNVHFTYLHREQREFGLPMAAGPTGRTAE